MRLDATPRKLLVRDLPRADDLERGFARARPDAGAVQLQAQRVAARLQAAERQPEAQGQVLAGSVVPGAALAQAGQAGRVAQGERQPEVAGAVGRGEDRLQLDGRLTQEEGVAGIEARALAIGQHPVEERIAELPPRGEVAGGERGVDRRAGMAVEEPQHAAHAAPEVLALQRQTVLPRRHLHLAQVEHRRQGLPGRTAEREALVDCCGLLSQAVQTPAAADLGDETVALLAPGQLLHGELDGQQQPRGVSGGRLAEALEEDPEVPAPRGALRQRGAGDRPQQDRAEQQREQPGGRAGEGTVPEHGRLLSQRPPHPREAGAVNRRSLGSAMPSRRSSR